jgi:hypothetical protein
VVKLLLAAVTLFLATAAPRGRRLDRSMGSSGHGPIGGPYEARLSPDGSRFAYYFCVQGARGSLAVAGKAGANTVRFRRRGLSRGSHRLLVSAAGRTASVPFRIVR